jgi:hypothetical protein
MTPVHFSLYAVVCIAEEAGEFKFKSQPSQDQ